jgi:hypothetical protein
MKIFKRGSMMQEHLKRASAETKTAGKAPSTNFEIILKLCAILNEIIKKEHTCIM